MRNRIIKQAKAIAKLMLIIVLTVSLIYSLVCLVSYERAKGIAIRYLQIVNYSKENYPHMKRQLYDIVTPETQKLLFSSESNIPDLPPIRYTVDIMNPENKTDKTVKIS